MRNLFDDLRPAPSNKSKKFESSTSQSLKCEAHLIYMNDGVNICAEACACCWDKPLPVSYQDRVVYLGKRVKMGHTSVLEHSNLVILCVVAKAYIKDLIEIAAEAQYLHTKIELNDSECIYMMIGGSYRGYNDLFRSVNGVLNNEVMRAISGVIYENIHMELFNNLCAIKPSPNTDQYIMDKDLFINVEPDTASRFFNAKIEVVDDKERLSIIAIDDIEQIHKNVSLYTGENMFNIYDLRQFATVSVLFRGLSRAATHQLVRHRNGITQESQRYVNYSNAMFVDPSIYKPDKYDTGHKYDIKIGKEKASYTMNELGNLIQSIYPQLLEQGVAKEDARGFLPINVACNKLYMTYTAQTLDAFFELRTNPGAQAEIRSYAIELANKYKHLSTEISDKKNSIKVDEIVSDEEEMFNRIVENEPELKD